MNAKSKNNAQIAIAIFPAHKSLANINGTIALNIKTSTCTKKVVRVRFKNFSKLFCFISAFDVSSIYFFSAFACHTISVIIPIKAYKHQVILVYA
jgi:hypothetical protein